MEVLAFIQVIFIIIFLVTFFKISYDARVTRKILEKAFGKLSKEELKELSFLKNTMR